MKNTRRTMKVRSTLRRIKYGRVAVVLGFMAVLGFGTYKVATVAGDDSVTQVAALEVEPIPVITYSDSRVDSYEPEILQSGKIRCMVYTGGDVTYTGVEPYVGCIAGSKELLGKSCYLYTVNYDGTKGNFIGRFKFDDTGYGVDGSIENGDAVCVYRSNLDGCNNWIRAYGDNVYIEVLSD